MVSFFLKRFVKTKVFGLICVTNNHTLNHRGNGYDKFMRPET